MVNRITLCYTFAYPVEVVLQQEEDGLSLVHIFPSNQKENELVVGPDYNGFGEIGCWDAGAEIKDGFVCLSGNDGPHGGKRNVELKIPLSLAKVKIERSEPYFHLDVLA